MNKLKMLPVGTENFEKIRTDNFYYVDKTRLIEQILEQKCEVSLFTRPRRFGKSLNMSMLKYFFNIGTDKSLFDGLYISNNKELTDKYMGKYPVISITLKGVEALNFDDAKYQFKELIWMETRNFSFLENSENLDVYDKEVYLSLCKMLDGRCAMNDETLYGSLQILSKLLYKHYGKKTIILIDEYDVPLDKAFQNGYYKEMISLIRLMFGKALKTNEYLEFAVLTGCLRISKESIFTGLNNFNVLSIVDEQYDEEFGFTEDEVKQLLEYYGLQDKYAEMKKWYDGYRFGDAEIYCPWDVINHVWRLAGNPNAEPQNYWLNSSGNDLVKGLIDKADKNTRYEIESLMEGSTIEKKLYLELTYDDLDTKVNNIWSVLFTTGYLTLADKPSNGIYKLRIPNYEIRKIYEDQILDWFDDVVLNDNGNLSSLWSSFIDGDTSNIESIINTFLNKTISVLDPKGSEKEKEKYYHAFLSGLLVGNQDWSVSSNKESGLGFADLILEVDNSNKGYVIEIKSVDKIAELDNACNRAIKQIYDKRYYDYLLDEDKTDVLLYGIAFYKKSCRVVCERLQRNDSSIKRQHHTKSI